MTDGDTDLDQHIARIVDVLAERFSSTHDRQTVEQAVVDARAQLGADARVTKYLPVLVTRRAINHLAGRPSASPTARIRPARDVQLANEVLRPVVPGVRMKPHVMASTSVRRLGTTDQRGSASDRSAPGSAGIQFGNFGESVVCTTGLTVELWTQSRSGSRS